MPACRSDRSPSRSNGCGTCCRSPHARERRCSGACPSGQACWQCARRFRAPLRSTVRGIPCVRRSARRARCRHRQRAAACPPVTPPEQADRSVRRAAARPSSLRLPHASPSAERPVPHSPAAPQRRAHCACCCKAPPQARQAAERLQARQNPRHRSARHRQGAFRRARPRMRGSALRQ